MTGRAGFKQLLSPHLYCLPHDRPGSLDMKSWGKESQLYLESQQTEEAVGQYPKEPSYLSQNSGFLFTKRVGSVADCYKLLDAGILCSCSCLCRSGKKCSYKPPTRKVSFSVLQLFKDNTFEENGLSYISQAIAFFQKGAGPACLSTGNRTQGLKLKEYNKYGVRFVLLLENLSRNLSSLNLDFTIVKQRCDRIRVGIR